MKRLKKIVEVSRNSFGVPECVYQKSTHSQDASSKQYSNV